MSRRAIALICFLAIAVLADSGTARAGDSGGITVLSATVADQRLEGAAILVQRAGRPTRSAITDARGHVALDTEALREPATRLSIRKDGYAELLARCPCDGLNYALSPAMQSLDGLRVVLDWGVAPTGLDLDSHLSYPGNHVYFERKNGDDASLDLDDTDHHGPETITVQRKRAGAVYTYAVHDFGNRQNPAADALANSQARVYVYVGQTLVRTYSVPRQPGNLWTVLRIDGEDRFEDINRISASSAAAEGIGEEIAQAPGGVDNGGAEDSEDAAQANERGETAYRAGDLSGAIAAYQQAIELDPGHALAYSNLGLAYVKQGRAAEAIWASRKAIALAKGANAASIRANAYYNIGKLYERDGQYERAMSNYLSAKREKPDKTYDEALERVSAY